MPGGASGGLRVQQRDARVPRVGAGGVEPVIEEAGVGSQELGRAAIWEHPLSRRDGAAHDADTDGDPFYAPV